MRADINTGIVLDKNYVYATMPDQEVFVIFDNIEYAIKFAKEIISEKKDIECGIYKDNSIALLILDHDNINLY